MNERCFNKKVFIATYSHYYYDKIGLEWNVIMAWGELHYTNSEYEIAFFSFPLPSVAAIILAVWALMYRAKLELPQPNSTAQQRTKDWILNGKWLKDDLHSDWD